MSMLNFARDRDKENKPATTFQPLKSQLFYQPVIFSNTLGGNPSLGKKILQLKKRIECVQTSALNIISI